MYYGLIFFSLIILIVLIALRKDTSTTSSFRWRLNGREHVKSEKCERCETANASISRLLLRSTLSSAGGLVGQTQSIPATKNLFEGDSATYFDQGMWGSCTAFAMKYALAIYGKSSSAYSQQFSAAHLYAQSRKLLGLGIKYDTGSSNWATARVVQTQGLLAEDQFPYWGKNIFTDPSSLSVRPSTRANFTNFVFSTNPTTNLKNIKTVLSTRPLIIAMVVYNSAMTTSVLVSGIIPMPNSSDLRGGVAGGHAICLTGYDTTHFIFRNSWGTDVGQQGTFKLPYAYLTTSSKGKMSYVFDAYYYV